MAFKVYEKAICKGCSQENYILNKSKSLCRYCVQNRDLVNKKARDFVKRVNKNSPKDHHFYKEMFNASPRICEECRIELREYNASYVSHIITKGANTALRFEPENIRIYCFDCHQRFEFMDRWNMKTYAENEEIRQRLTLKYYTSK